MCKSLYGLKHASSLYGLKHASRCWFAKLIGALTQCDFCQFYSDYSLFTYSSGSIFLFVLIDVDYLIIIGNDLSSLQKFKTHLSTCLHVKDLGLVKYFLDIEVTRTKKCIYLCQRMNALDILSDASFLGDKPLTFLMEQNHLLGKAKGSVASS